MSEINHGSSYLSTTAKARAYLSANQLNLVNNVWMKVQLNTETYDVGGDFDVGELVSGTADGTTAFHLIDSGTNFITSGVVIGDRVKNTTDTTYAHVTAVADGDLTIDVDIFESTETYEIKKARFVAPISGYYQVSGGVAFLAPVAAKYYIAGIFVDGAIRAQSLINASVTSVVGSFVLDTIYVAADSYIELFAKQNSGAATVDLEGTTQGTFMSVHLISV